MSGQLPPSAQPANAQAIGEPAISSQWLLDKLKKKSRQDREDYLRILRFHVKEGAAENALQQARNTTISESVLQKLQKLEGEHPEHEVDAARDYERMTRWKLVIEKAVSDSKHEGLMELVRRVEELTDEGLTVLKKSIDKSVRRVAEHRERDELVIELAQSGFEAMEEGEERKHEVEKLEFKKKKRMFESLVDAAMHDGLQKLTGAVEEIVRNHVPNEAAAHQS
ncbi:hypothetical protein J4E89_004543 [Alternaria sp. Ai002NY15]|nr:hypothetical protein J4E89_004543 [Alternaria sp. Ai002NY15]